MGLLKFTKDYSASDNGSSVSGVDMQNVQTDIAAIINGNITNVNINASAGIVESKLTFDTTSGHNHDGATSRVLSSGAFRAFIQGAELEYVATDQVKAGSGVMDIGGSLYTRTSYSTTIDLDTATHWVEGSSQRGTSKWAYVYAYNDSGTTYDIKYWLQAPQYANTVTDDSSVKIYRQSGSAWYRCLGAVMLNSTGSGNIEQFYQRDNWIFYNDAYLNATAQVLNAGGEVAFTDVDCSSVVPVISAYAYINVFAGGRLTAYFRINGGAATSGIALLQYPDDTWIDYIEILTDTSQVFEYQVSRSNITVYVSGYQMNIR